LFTGAFGNLRQIFIETKAGLVGKISEQLRQADRTALAPQAIWLTMIVCILANLTAMILASTGNVGGPQGRYLFTSEVPFLATIVLGLSFIDKVWGRRLVVTLVIFNVFVYIWSFAMLFPIYGFRWKAF
jgi:hypothetical protein